jgi:hypothetical protein
MGLTMRRKLIRGPKYRRYSAQIQETKTIKGSNLIKYVFVSVAFYQDPDSEKGFGRLYFVCPFCHTINWHGAGRFQKFGSADSPRIPHCSCEDPENTFGKLSREIFSSLAPGWRFHIKEVENPELAGDLPKEIRKHLTSRKKR